KKLFLTLSLAFLAISCSDTPNSPSVPPTEPPDPPVEVEASIPSIDNSVKQFMQRWDIPGLSLAIVKNGRLVYAKGYGYANKESFIKVDTTSLFRIASLSKTITAIGIMQLIE